MNDNTEATDRGDQLQFEHAESVGEESAVGMQCSGCHRPIVDAYYQVNGRIACADCRGAVASAWDRGSGLARTVKAVLGGGGAGLVGAGIYYGVTAATGYEIGLIAIVVGLLVGGAVRWGAERRGGLYYQVLAVLLTYLAVAGSYSIFAVQAVIAYERGHARSDAITATQESQETPGDQAAEDDEAEAADASGSAVRPPPTAGVVLGTFGAILWFAVSLPIRANLESPIGLFIVAIALYEAWRINKTAGLVIGGPYYVADPVPSADTQPPSGPVSEHS